MMVNTRSKVEDLSDIILILKMKDELLSLR